MRILASKSWRICRRLPQEFFGFLAFPFSDRGATWQAIVFVALVALLLGTGRYSEATAMFFDWILLVQAFGIALLIWTVVGLIRSPFAVISKDKALRKWTRNHFLYHHPQLVFSDIIAAEDGATQAFELFIPDVEPSSFATFTYEVGEQNNKFPNAIFADFIGGDLKPDYEISIPKYANQLCMVIRPKSRFGQRLNRKRKLIMYLRFSPEQSPRTVRLFCHGFFIGKNSDFDYR
jgi:hypothetical protein